MISHRIKLRGGLVKTASSVYVGDRGEVCVELYDFSEAAQNCFGNDVAYTLHIADNATLCQLLQLHPGTPLTQIVDALGAEFIDYFDLKRWLEENSVDFREEFESWA